MTRLQKIFFGIGIVIVIGLSVFVFRQMSNQPSPSKNITPNVSTQEPVKNMKPSDAVLVPSTPDTVTDDILKEIDTDNSALNEEELGATSAIEAEGSVVSDFGTTYDANQN